MKKLLAFALAAMLLLGSVAMAETVTGTAQGLMGTVSVTLTVEDGKIVDAVIDASAETQAIVADKLDAMKAFLLANDVEAIKAFDVAQAGAIDGVAGATYTITGVVNAAKAALVAGAEAPAAEPAPAVEAPALVTASAGNGLVIRQAQYACHGTKCFAIVTVVMNGDTIVKAYIDEFQAMANTNTLVPNSDAMFPALAEAGNGLLSKRVNNAAYSASMASKGGATQELLTSYQAIEAFVAGKTVAELDAVDAVSGSTLADTKGYLQGIIEAAKGNDVAADAAAPAAITFGQVQFACHGTKCFAIVSVVMDGDKIVAAHIDEFQVMAYGESETTTFGVPNAAAMFAADAEAGKHLVSKRVNNAVYSKNMTKSGSTQDLAVSYAAIEAFCVGKTIAELEEVVGLENVVDAVSGSTLADTKGYILGIIEAAKAAQ